MESHLSIEEVARRTGLTAHTLRYYERIGLDGIKFEPPRSKARVRPEDSAAEA